MLSEHDQGKALWDLSKSLWVGSPLIELILRYTHLERCQVDSEMFRIRFQNMWHILKMV